jgi:hypothetical protein
MKAFIRLVLFAGCLVAVGVNPARTQQQANDPLLERVVALEQRLDQVVNDHAAMMAKIDLLVEKLDKLVDPLAQAPIRAPVAPAVQVAAAPRFTYKMLANGALVACDENGCQVVSGVTYSTGFFGRQYATYSDCATCDSSPTLGGFQSGPIRRGLFGRRR